MIKMKIAVPVDITGKLDTHFGHCRYFLIVSTEGDNIIHDELLQPPPHEPGVLPQWLAGLEVTDVLSGGMGNRAIQLFNHNNIRVYTGAPSMQANELVKGFLDNSIQFTGNNCDH